MIESTFATLRHRTKRVKGAFSKDSALAMMLQLASRSAEALAPDHRGGATGRTHRRRAASSTAWRNSRPNQHTFEDRTPG
jgi:hypothetical protein